MMEFLQKKSTLNPSHQHNLLYSNDVNYVSNNLKSNWNKDTMLAHIVALVMMQKFIHIHGRAVYRIACHPQPPQFFKYILNLL